MADRSAMDQHTGDTTESEDMEDEPPHPFFIPFQIHIHGPQGYLFDLNVNHYMLGFQLYDLIFQRLGRPFRMFITRSNGEQIDILQDQTLHSLDIKENSIIYTVLRLRIPDEVRASAAAEAESSRVSEDSGYDRSSESSSSSRSAPYISESEGESESDTESPQRPTPPSPFRVQGGTRKSKRFKKRNTVKRKRKRKTKSKNKSSRKRKGTVKQQTLYRK
jgi:hypothetical protein